MGLRSRNKISANFNMSSMTDIVFLLLIFFMLTSTLVSPNALKLLLPSSKAKTLEKQTISISITKDIDFYINENKITAASIEQELKLLINNETEPAIILHTDKTVAIEHVVKIMDIAYRNKNKIVIATTPN
jgi:biopolymer transport protein ExbD